MTNLTSAFDYPPVLQEYAVPEKEYLRQHPECNVLCTGIVVFNKDGKLLLVQRAADEKAFPNMWVSNTTAMTAQHAIKRKILNPPVSVLNYPRKSQVARSMTLTRRFSTQLSAN
jgi:isopentenyldiphosphate isomerase